jgi:hypothetical protein
MWVFQNSSFLSVVAHKDRPGHLLVRSRIKGDIERAIPEAKVFEDVDADYRYRAVVPTELFKDAMGEAVDRIDYYNFKNSVRDGPRHDAYMSVWQVMASKFGAFVGRSSRRDSESNFK